MTSIPEAACAIYRGIREARPDLAFEYAAWTAITTLPAAATAEDVLQARDAIEEQRHADYFELGTGAALQHLADAAERDAQVAGQEPGGAQ